MKYNCSINLLSVEYLSAEIKLHPAKMAENLFVFAPANISVHLPRPLPALNCLFATGAGEAHKEDAPETD